MFKKSRILLTTKGNPSILQNVFITTKEYNNELKRCYALLNIREGCDQETVRQAYLALAKRFHPDSGSAEASEDKFKEIENAFRVINKKQAQDRWGVSEEMQVEQFDIQHTAPQHRQYLSYEGVGSGTPAQRQKQWTKARAARAAQNVMEHRVNKAAATEHALLDKNTTRKHKHDIKTKYGFDRLVEDLIQESMSKGEFSNLQGSGKPLPLHQNTNPYVDFVTHKMNQVLIDNGFTPEWITLQKDIRKQIEVLRSSLLAERCLLGSNPITPSEEIKWRTSIEKHENIVKLINSKIVHYNLVVPILQKQMFLVSLEKEAKSSLENGKNNSEVPPPVKNENLVENHQTQDHDTVMSLFFQMFKL